MESEFKIKNWLIRPEPQAIERFNLYKLGIVTSGANIGTVKEDVEAYAIKLSTAMGIISHDHALNMELKTVTEFIVEKEKYIQELLLKFDEHRKVLYKTLIQNGID